MMVLILVAPTRPPARPRCRLCRRVIPRGDGKVWHDCPRRRMLP